MDLGRASRVIKDLRLPPYRLDQVRRAVFGRAAASYDEVSVLPFELRRELARSAPILCLSLRESRVSADGLARKAALTLCDGRVVETVLLRPSPRRWTACVSTQVGCAFGCAFCATGRMGFVRDLTAEEISDQVLFWRQSMRQAGGIGSSAGPGRTDVHTAGEGLEGRLDNVVYMGMGEPLANYEAVAESLRWLLDPKQHGIGARHVSVSTVGIPAGIERFARDFPQVNLAVSLHAADDALRTRLVPANKAFPLAEISRALERYLGSSSRKVMLEYALLAGVNDRAGDADALVAFVRRLGRPELFHVNLILYNPTTGPWKPASEAEARRFQDRLLAAGLKVTLRQSLGSDIQGACGQLASERS